MCFVQVVDCVDDSGILKVYVAAELVAGVLNSLIFCGVSFVSGV